MYRLAQFDGDDHSVESTLDYTDWDEWRERYINEHLTKKKAKIEPTIDTKKDLHKPKSQRSEMRINHEAHHKKQKQIKEVDSCSESDDESPKILKKHSMKLKKQNPPRSSEK